MNPQKDKEKCWKSDGAVDADNIDALIVIDQWWLSFSALHAHYYALFRWFIPEDLKFREIRRWSRGKKRRFRMYLTVWLVATMRRATRFSYVARLAAVMTGMIDRREAMQDFSNIIDVKPEISKIPNPNKKKFNNKHIKNQHVVVQKLTKHFVVYILYFT